MSKKKSSNPSAADPHREREQQRYERPIPSREYILEVLAEQSRPLRREHLARALGVEGNEEREEALRRRLRAMERDGQVIRNRRQQYVVVDDEDLVRGRVRADRDGSGMLRPDSGGDPVYLSPRQMRSLLNGDRAVVRIINVDQQGRPEGELVEVIQRSNREITGRFFSESGVGFVVSDNRRIHQDVIIPLEAQAGAQTGQLVVAEITRQPSDRRQPIGRIVKILGEHIAPGTEIDFAARVHGIPVEWPEEVEREIATLGSEVPEEAKEGRLDLRGLPLVTIDGPDARDFDDAVYCEPTSKGFRLIVAIADVSHYVQPGSALNREASERGNSVYFPRSVVPMLPEVLSNGLCSLNPKVDRLCMACEMLIDTEGRLRRSRFFKGVMRSKARFTYDEVAAIHVDRDAALRKQYKGLLKHIDHLFSVYRALRKDRERRGAIDFETTETEMHFDGEGRVTEIVPTRRNDAHRLIEECMVKANVAAARFLRRHQLPGLYRIHEGPDDERLATLREFLNQLALRLEGGDSPEPKDYARLLHRIRDRADRHLIETVLLRSMMAAEYSPDNAGHFGLALDAYAHFTSPIRRYPDLVVHRAIGHVLDGGKGQDFPLSHDHLITLGEHCSMTDRRAEEATRDAAMTLKCQYMADKLGQDFTGVVSGVTSFGLFVELDGIYVDGLIHVTNLENDFFHFDPIGHRLVGERSGKVYRLTDRVVVRVARVDVDERKLDFALVAHPVDEQGNPVEQKQPRQGERRKRGAKSGAAARRKTAAKGRRGKGRPARR